METQDFSVIAALAQLALSKRAPSDFDESSAQYLDKGTYMVPGEAIISPSTRMGILQATFFVPAGGGKMQPVVCNLPPSFVRGRDKVHSLVKVSSTADESYYFLRAVVELQGTGEEVAAKSTANSERRRALRQPGTNPIGAKAEEKKGG